MKTFPTPSLFLVLFIWPACISNAYAQTALEYYNKGEKLKNQGSFKAAIEQYQLAGNLWEKEGQIEGRSVAINSIGSMYQLLKHYDKANGFYQQALHLAEKCGNKNNVAVYTNNIGLIYQIKGDYEKALQYLHKALDMTVALKAANDKNNKASDSYAGWDRYFKTVISSYHYNIGIVHEELKDDSAIGHYIKAADLALELGQDNNALEYLNYIGRSYDALGKYTEALQFYKKVKALAGRLGKKEDVAISLNNIGAVYKAWGKYDTAMIYLNISMDLNKAQGIKREIMVNLGNIGQVYEFTGQFDKAIAHYRQALSISRTIGEKQAEATTLNNIGMVYFHWGKYDRAREHFQQALEIDKKEGAEEGLGTIYNNIGLTYKFENRYQLAIDFYSKALGLARQNNKKGDMAVCMNNIGNVYMDFGQYEKALEHFRSALAIDKELGHRDKVALRWNNIGMVYFYQTKYDEALKCYQKALAVAEEIGQADRMAVYNNNLGNVYYFQEAYAKAAKAFEKSVRIKEKLRKTAQGELRRDYLASQVYSYQYLASTYIRMGKYARALSVIELSRSKLLAEQLNKGSDMSLLPSIKDIQKNLNNETAILSFANIDWASHIKIMIAHDKINGMETPDSLHVIPALEKHNTAITVALKGKRGFIRQEKKAKDQDIDNILQKSNIEHLVNYYRTLLTNPVKANTRKTRELGRLFYNYLIQDLSEPLKDKVHLIIIPDGVLNFLPFETLIDGEGKYLAEKFNITYAPSVGVLEIIKKRIYTAKRKPMLAFGGAIYRPIAFTGKKVENSKELAYLLKRTREAMNKGGSTRMSYFKLGIGSWPPLPGTLKEVKAISTIVKKSKVITGDKVSESNIKTKSQKRELKKYRIIHFATHGLSVPEIPALSALVLSQHEKEEKGEDGYLQMNEIADLELKADFVNLSACETGLGKLYQGEGVVGLTQAFFIAGANGLSVSLWQVADESTMKFMKSFYKSVWKKEKGYAEAMTEVKRGFIKGAYGETYKQPYFWAPFVYYGR